MIVADFLGKQLQSKASKLLFTNKLGGFFLYSPQSFTKYQGLSFNEKSTFKAIEEIQIQDKKEIKQIKYNSKYFSNIYEDLTESYYFPDDENSLLHELSSERHINIILDCRKVDDFSSWGRYYEVKQEKGCIVIKYTKKKDYREASQDEYEFYIAIKSSNTEFEKKDSWQEKRYPFDESRKDSSSRYVYHALTLNSNKLGFGFSTDKSNAIKIATNIYKNSISSLKIEVEKPEIKNASTEINYAYSLSVSALKSLMVKTKRQTGVYAGLPWFNQFWTRDTAISAKAYSLIGENDFMKEILISCIQSAKSDGLIPNRKPSSDLASIDGSGLVISRLNEFISSMNKEEIKKVKEMIRNIAINLVSFHSRQSMVSSLPYESWMDTDIRSGALIEIQALQLSIYSTLKRLSDICKDKKTSQLCVQLESELKQEVRANFFFNGDLFDSLSSTFRRPNVFLAYYFYPELLSNKEWTSVFDKHIKSLYLNWGGLSTLDLSSPYFVQNHSGTDNLSYHKGDSWFFINNIAAICLYKVDKKRYRKYIDSILNASTEDILNKGIFGFSSELSSASHQEATGCLAQLWSSATYVELIREIYGK